MSRHRYPRVYWYRAAAVGGDTYIVQHCYSSSSPEGGDANIMTGHRRTGQHPFGGADPVLPEWIQWGGG